jgi:hypothetical protein
MTMDIDIRCLFARSGCSLSTLLSCMMIDVLWERQPTPADEAPTCLRRTRMVSTLNDATSKDSDLECEEFYCPFSVEKYQSTT